MEKGIGLSPPLFPIRSGPSLPAQVPGPNTLHSYGLSIVVSKKKGPGLTSAVVLSLDYLETCYSFSVISVTMTGVWGEGRDGKGGDRCETCREGTRDAERPAFPASRRSWARFILGNTCAIHNSMNLV